VLKRKPEPTARGLILEALVQRRNEESTITARLSMVRSEIFRAETASRQELPLGLCSGASLQDGVLTAKTLPTQICRKNVMTFGESWNEQKTVDVPLRTMRHYHKSLVQSQSFIAFQFSIPLTILLAAAALRNARSDGTASLTLAGIDRGVIVGGAVVHHASVLPCHHSGSAFQLLIRPQI
jgi:hypothetical protein